LSQHVGRGGRDGKQLAKFGIRGLYAGGGGRNIAIGFGLAIVEQFGETALEGAEQRLAIVCIGENDSADTGRGDENNVGLVARQAAAMVEDGDAPASVARKPHAVETILTVGDIGFQRKCYKKLEELMAGGMTCLFVTHDLGAVVRFCHRAVVLFQGQKIFEGDPRQACNVLNKIYFGEAGVDDKLDYGDGAAMIDQIWFEDETGERLASVPARSPLVFSYSCRFNTAVTDPVFGFHIKTVYGMEVCTASSDYMGYEFGSFEPGDRLTLKWTLDLNLNPGTYFFGCGCRYANESRFMSRRVDAMKFPIVDNPTFGGIVNVFRDLKIEKTLANAESEPQMNADGLR